jgi:hypothetical protein
MANPLYTQNIIACIWDFDKTLIPEYMQSPLFKRYGVNESEFWKETNALVEEYHKRGYRLSGEIGYLNHLLTYVLSGKMAGLNNKILKEVGKDIKFYPGLPEFFEESKKWVSEKAEFVKHDIKLEHYIVSTGLAEMIRGSKVAPFVDGIWGCEFIESPLQPGFLKQGELSISAEAEIAQIGMVIDNTTKTRALFEINKGTNKNTTIDVNSNVKEEDRRIPFQNMIYIADGPSDVPSFSVVKSKGGKAYGVFNPARSDEFAQNDRLRQSGRIDHYGEADYNLKSNTSQWLKLQVNILCESIIVNREIILAQKTIQPPKHLNSDIKIKTTDKNQELF